MSDQDPDGADAAEDSTQLSQRTWAEAAEDVTQLSSRTPAPQDGDDEDDDSTRMSVRREDEAADVTRVSARREEDDDDSTRVSASRAAEEDSTQLSDQQSHQTGGTSSEQTQVAGAVRRRRERARPSLPPGHVVGPETHEGSFGQSETAYGPRGVPIPRNSAHVDAEPSQATTPGRTVLTPAQAAQRRDAERRRRLTVVIIVASTAAAVLTAAVMGALALWGGGA